MVCSFAIVLATGKNSTSEFLSVKNLRLSVRGHLVCCAILLQIVTTSLTAFLKLTTMDLQVVKASTRWMQILSPNWLLACAEQGRKVKTASLNLAHTFAILMLLRF